MREDIGIPVTRSDNDFSAEQHFNMGNICCINDKYDFAINSFAMDEVMLTTDSAGDLKNATLKFRILSHRSQAFLELKRYQESFEDSKMAIQILNDCMKTYNFMQGEIESLWKRNGFASFQLEKYDEALKSYSKASQLASLNSSSDGNSESVSDYYTTWIKKCEQELKILEQKQTKVDPTLQGADTTQEPTEDPKISATESLTIAVAPTNTFSVSTTDIYRVPKYQYYQNDNYMTIMIMESSLNAERLKVVFEEKVLIVTIQNWRHLNKRNEHDYHSLIYGTLYDAIIPSESKVVYKDEKTYIKLKKSKAFDWSELMSKQDPLASTASQKEHYKNLNSAARKIKVVASDDMNDVELKKSEKALETDSAPSALPRPYASKTDWNKFDDEEDTDGSKASGDESLNKIFAAIYQNATPETRRAMIKSYQTSGGTVLSTNWDEVKETDYENERTAPKGMEWKTWEGKKLPMKDED